MAATSGQSVENGLYLYERNRLPATNEIQLSDATVRISLGIEQPDIALIENFLSPAECEEMIALSQASCRPRTSSTRRQENIVRLLIGTSEGAMFQRGEVPVVARVENRIAELMRWPVENGEGIQVLHYRAGGEYRPHYDYFPPHSPGSAKQMVQGGQRIATLIMYLNEVPDGGATIFPGLTLGVAPRRGTVVYFSYFTSLGQIDSATLHGGSPVLSGEKWIATKWLRERRYG